MKPKMMSRQHHEIALRAAEDAMGCLVNSIVTCYHNAPPKLVEELWEELTDQSMKVSRLKNELQKLA